MYAILHEGTNHARVIFSFFVSIKVYVVKVNSQREAPHR